MKGENEPTITAAVLASIANAPDPRVRQISDALIRHLHAFISEIEPTEKEWEQGIEFLTKTGQMCSKTRQEFILLSDTLGVSMLVDAINHRFPAGATESTVFGPFYTDAAPVCALGQDIKGHLEGSPMYVGGTVRDVNGKAIAGAIVDVWHSDKDGFYDLQLLDQHPEFAARGRFRCDQNGAFHLWTVRPAPYPIPADGPVGKMLQAQSRHPYRPEHIHFMIQAAGYRRLITHIFAAGGKYLDSDVVFGVKDSLIQEFEAHSGGSSPDGKQMSGQWFCLQHDFVLAEKSGS